MTTNRSLSNQQREFASIYVFDSEAAGNGAASAIRAGYAEDSARQQAYRLLRNENVRAEIDRLTREALGDGAAASVALLRRVIEDPRTDAAMMRIKLDAAKAVLDRAGYIAPKAAEPPNDPISKPMREWSLAELNQFIEDSRAKLAAMQIARSTREGEA